MADDPRSLTSFRIPKFGIPALGFWKKERPDSGGPLPQKVNPMPAKGTPEVTPAPAPAPKPLPTGPITEPRKMMSPLEAGLKKVGASVERGGEIVTGRGMGERKVFNPTIGAVGQQAAAPAAKRGLSSLPMHLMRQRYAKLMLPR